MKACQLVFCLIFTFIINLSHIAGQKLIADTSFVDVPVDKIDRRVGGSLNRFEDERTKDKQVLRITHKKVYNYIPVDHFILIDTTMEGYLLWFFSSNEPVSFDVTVNRFEMNKRSGLLFPGLSLQAFFEVDVTLGEVKLSGDLLYDEWISPRGRDKKGTNLEAALLSKWEGEFYDDLNDLIAHQKNTQKPLPYNFSQQNIPPKTNLEMDSRIIGGLDYYIIEAELIFFEPEANPRTFRTGHIFRYRNEQRFESVGFGRNYEHIYFRRNNRLVIDANVNFMLGVNRWKDIEEFEHPIWHVVLLDLSFGQYIKYQPFSSQRGIVFGGGIFENVYYIPDGWLRFKPGIAVQIGYRF